MNLLYPLGLLGLAALVPIVALYFLKLKREERVVPSTLLWKKVIDDMQVNAPFQRLKYSLLLLLQLFLIILLGLALARPYLDMEGAVGRKVVILIDTSASMATRDAGPDGTQARLEAAKADAVARVDAMSDGDEIAVVAFDTDARILTRSTNNRGILRKSIEGLETRDLGTRAEEAFDTAFSLIQDDPDAEVLVYSDGCFGAIKLGEDVKGNTEDTVEGANRQADLLKRRESFRFVSFGKDISDNVGITQIAANTRPKRAQEDGKVVERLETQVSVMVENFSPYPKDVVLSLSLGDERLTLKTIALKGRALRTETLAEIKPSGNTDDESRSVEVFKLPLDAAGVITARIDLPNDSFSVDDVASAVVGISEGTKVLLVLKDAYFLEKAIASIRGVTVTKMSPDDFAAKWQASGQDSVESYDVCIFHDTAPLSWSEGGAIFFGVIPPIPGFAKDEKPPQPTEILDWDDGHPAMRYAKFANVSVSKAQSWRIPKTAKVLVEGTTVPLVAAYETDRLRAIGISFDIFSSDWAYRPALPLFCWSAVPWASHASPRRRPSAQLTGEPLSVPPGLGDGRATLTKPDGSKENVELSAEHTVYIKGTEKAGLYEISGLANGGARAYAFNLGSRAESTNAAQTSISLGDSAVATAPLLRTAKREVWPYLALAALLILLIEWFVFHQRLELWEWHRAHWIVVPLVIAMGVGIGASFVNAAAVSAGMKGGVALLVLVYLVLRAVQDRTFEKRELRDVRVLRSWFSFFEFMSALVLIFLYLNGRFSGNADPQAAFLSHLYWLMGALLIGTTLFYRASEPARPMPGPTRRYGLHG